MRLSKSAKCEKLLKSIVAIFFILRLIVVNEVNKEIDLLLRNIKRLSNSTGRFGKDIFLTIRNALQKAG